MYFNMIIESNHAPLSNRESNSNEEICTIRMKLRIKALKVMIQWTCACILVPSLGLLTCFSFAFLGFYTVHTCYSADIYHTTAIFHCFLHIIKVHPGTTDENDLFATPGTIHLLSNVPAEETKYAAIARCTTMNSDYKCTTLVSNLVLHPLSAIKHNITGKN